MIEAGNALDVGYVKVWYTSPYGEHTLTFEIFGATEQGFGIWNLVTASGSEVLFSSAMSTLADELVKMISTGYGLLRAELWVPLVIGGAPIFREVRDLSANVGTFVGSSEAIRATWVFRTSAGGIKKFVMMGVPIVTGDTLTRYRASDFAPSSPVTAVAEAIFNPAGVVAPRDSGIIVSWESYLMKYDDVLRRKQISS